MPVVALLCILFFYRIAAFVHLFSRKKKSKRLCGHVSEGRSILGEKFLQRSIVWKTKKKEKRAVEKWLSFIWVKILGMCTSVANWKFKTSATVGNFMAASKGFGKMCSAVCVVISGFLVFIDVLLNRNYCSGYCVFNSNFDL